jgi:hypothetical protein
LNSEVDIQESGRVTLPQTVSYPTHTGAVSWNLRTLLLISPVLSGKPLMNLPSHWHGQLKPQNVVWCPSHSDRLNMKRPIGGTSDWNMPYHSGYAIGFLQHYFIYQAP